MRIHAADRKRLRDDIVDALEVVLGRTSRPDQREHLANVLMNTMEEIAATLKAEEDE